VFLSRGVFVHLKIKAVAFETCCVYSVMYVFLRRWKKSFYMLVMCYRLFRCQEIPWCMLDCVWNVMAHAQKPDFVFRRIGRVHLNRQGRQFSRLLAAELCASAVVMLDTPCSEVVWRVLDTHCIPQFPLPCVTVCHHVSTGLYQSLSSIGLSCSGVKWKHLVHFSGRFTDNQQVYQPVFIQGT